MSLYEFLQLQPVEPQADGTVSDLDIYRTDDEIDLNNEDIDNSIWDKINKDDSEVVKY